MNAKTKSIVSTSHLIIAKDPINVSWNQKKRAKFLFQESSSINIAIIRGDNSTFELGNLLIEISPSVPHGYDTKRGHVFMVRLFDKEAEKGIIFSSDVEGIGSFTARSWILEKILDAIILDGPAYYHPNVKKNEIDFEIESIKNVQDSIKNIFLEHHFNRAFNRDNFSKEHSGTTFRCASNIVNLKPLFLEAKREYLWQQFPWGDSRNWSRQISAILNDPIIKEKCIKELEDYLNYLTKVKTLINPVF